MYRIVGDVIETDFCSFPMPTGYMPRKELEQYVAEQKRAAMKRFTNG